MNSTAEATTAGSSAPSVDVERAEPADGVVEPGISAIQRTYSRDGTRSPVSTTSPSSNASDDVVEIVDVDAPAERREQRLRDQPLDDPLLGRLVADRLQLDLADRRGDDRAQVGDARRGHGLAEPDGAAQRRGLAGPRRSRP